MSSDEARRRQEELSRANALRQVAQHQADRANVDRANADRVALVSADALRRQQDADAQQRRDLQAAEARMRNQEHGAPRPIDRYDRTNTVGREGQIAAERRRAQEEIVRLAEARAVMHRGAPEENSRLDARKLVEMQRTAREAAANLEAERDRVKNELIVSADALRLQQDAAAQQRRYREATNTVGREDQIVAERRRAAEAADCRHAAEARDVVRLRAEEEAAQAVAAERCRLAPRQADKLRELERRELERRRTGGSGTLERTDDAQRIARANSARLQIAKRLDEVQRTKREETARLEAKLLDERRRTREQEERFDVMHRRVPEEGSRLDARKLVELQRTAREEGAQLEAKRLLEIQRTAFEEGARLEAKRLAADRTARLEGMQHEANLFEELQRTARKDVLQRQLLQLETDRSRSSGRQRLTGEEELRETARRQLQSLFSVFESAKGAARTTAAKEFAKMLVHALAPPDSWDYETCSVVWACGGSWGRVAAVLMASGTDGVAIGEYMEAWRAAQVERINQAAIDAYPAEGPEGAATTRVIQRTGTPNFASDLEMNIVGPHAVAQREHVERYMVQTFGEGWRDLLNATFLVDPRRLHMFDQLDANLARIIELDLVAESEFNVLARVMAEDPEQAKILALAIGLPKKAGLAEITRRTKNAVALAEAPEKIRELESHMDDLHAEFDAQTDGYQKAAIAKEMAILQGRINLTNIRAFVTPASQAFVTPGGAAMHVSRREDISGTGKKAFEALSPAMRYMTLLDDMAAMIHTSKQGSLNQYQHVKSMAKYAERLLIAAGLDAVPGTRAEAKALYDNISDALAAARRNPAALMDDELLHATIESSFAQLEPILKVILLKAKEAAMPRAREAVQKKALIRKAGSKKPTKAATRPRVG